jgi:hypothetical protein
MCSSNMVAECLLSSLALERATVLVFSIHIIIGSYTVKKLWNRYMRVTEALTANDCFNCHCGTHLSRKSTVSLLLIAI